MFQIVNKHIGFYGLFMPNYAIWYLLIKAPSFIYISTIWVLWQNICKNYMQINPKNTEYYEWNNRMVKRNETNEDEREDRARNVVKLRRAVEITREWAKCSQWRLLIEIIEVFLGFIWFYGLFNIQNIYGLYTIIAVLAIY
jgi:hypothetical protein